MRERYGLTSDYLFMDLMREIARRGELKLRLPTATT